jgi:hypothetical protein
MSPRFAVASTLVIVLGAAGAAHAVELQPYRAGYELRLESASQGSGIVDLSGRMALEWADACEGYTLTQRMGFRLNRADSNQVQSDVFVSTWESRDGMSFRYAMRTTLNGVVTEEYQGRATLDPGDRSGKAVFTKPEGLTVGLPPGTRFPTDHAKDLVEGAVAGDRRVARKVFEGTAGETVYNAVAFVGAALAPDTGSPRRKALEGLQAWRVDIAYFALEKADDLPEYEVGLRLFDNGISDEVELNYGDFVVGAELTELELLPPSGC